MKIQRRNRSDLSIAVVAILFLGLPFIFFSNFIQTTSITYFIIIGIGSLLFTYYMKQFQLSKAEVKYIENEADCIIEQKHSTRGNYAFVLILFVNLFIADPVTEKFYFGLSLASILFFIGIFIYKEVNKTNFSLERLFFLPEQIIYIGNRQKVVTISDIEGLYLKEENLYIREKYGVLEFSTNDLQEAERQKLRLQIIKISKELTIDSKFLNISI